MPDIVMCPGGDCPRKESCYRYKAVPSYRQSYADFNARRENSRCNNFMEIWDNDTLEVDGRWE